MRKGGGGGVRNITRAGKMRAGEKNLEQKGASYFSNVVTGWVGLFKSKRWNICEVGISVYLHIHSHSDGV